MNTHHTDNSEQIDLIARTVVEHTDQLDRLSDTVLRNSDRFDAIDAKLEQIVTRGEHQEVMNALDTLVKLAKKRDDELTMLSHRVTEHTKDLEKIKPLVGIGSV